MSGQSDRPVLHADEVDLESLVLARNDVHPAGDWWFDPHSGRSLYHGVDDDADLAELVTGVHVLIPRAPQPREDIFDFFDEAEALGVDQDTMARLWSAFRGKGGARRFRELVGRTPAADAWSRFTLRREGGRALDWLLERGLVDACSTEARRESL